MQQQAHTIAQRLLNLYRQAHVIDGGWAAVNKVFIAESNDAQVMTELESMPTGKKLVTHINNLRSGKTPMDTIDKDLLPYGGLMSGQKSNISLTENEINQLKFALSEFQPTIDGLNTIKQLPFVQKFGNDWIEDIKSAIAFDKDMLSKWNLVAQTDTAYRIWDSAKELLSETLTERNRAQIQADMPEFETYLPMFGDTGNEMLAKLRTFMSSLS
jgi:hypothetical protein